MADLPLTAEHTAEHTAPQWLDGEQATCERWHALVTARQAGARTGR
ncbi:hypothetical protein [Streptomyces mirabilis]